MSPYRARGLLETAKSVLEVLALCQGCYPQLKSSMRSLFSRARRRTT